MNRYGFDPATGTIYVADARSALAVSGLNTEIRNAEVRAEAAASVVAQLKESRIRILRAIGLSDDDLAALAASDKIKECKVNDP